jgi:hypothetical protein
MKINWIVSHDGRFNTFGHECLRCGAYHKLPQYLPEDDFLEIAQAFIALHKLCRKTDGPTTDPGTVESKTSPAEDQYGTGEEEV